MKKRKLLKRIRHLEWELFQRRFEEGPTVSKVRILLGDDRELVVPVASSVDEKIVDLPGLGYDVKVD